MLSKNVRNIILKTGITLSVALTSVSVPVFMDEPITVSAATLINKSSGELSVTASSIWTYNSANWAARTKVFNKGTKFNVVGKFMVDGREMYSLSNGLYITANPKYISFKDNAPTSVSKPAATSNTTARPTHNLNMRKGPGTNNGIILTIPKGSVVKVENTTAGWSKVSYSGKTGYVSHNYLGSFQSASGQTPPATTAPSKPSLPVVNVSSASTTVNLNMRTGGSTSNPIILTIPRGREVTIHQTSNGWSKVTYSGKTGYVSHQYLLVKQVSKPVVTPKPVAPKPVEPVKPTTPAPAPTEDKVQGTKKTTANLYMRVGPDKTTASVLIIPKGAEVEFIKEVNGWSHVIYKGKRGYSSSKFLTTLVVTKPIAPVAPVAPVKPAEPVNPVQPEKPGIPGENINLPSVLTINGVKNNQGVPSGNTTVYGDALHGMGVKSVQYIVNGQVKGEATFGTATNDPNRYTDYPAYSKAGYSFTLKSSDLNPAGMNTVQVILTGNNENKYGQSVILRGNNTGQFKQESYSKTRDYYAQLEINKVVNYHPSTTLYQVQTAMDPGSNIADSKMQYLFMDLSYDESLNFTAAQLDSILLGKGVLEGKGDVFLKAAQKHKVNPFYALAHAIHETGNGKSVLSKGQTMAEVHQKLGTVDLTGIPVEELEKVVYNVFGIGAANSNAQGLGGMEAYKQGWFSVDEAIEGGIEWISVKYVNYKDPRNTLYKMRFNFNTHWKQYATDLYWAEKQTKNIAKQIESFNIDKSKLTFIYPTFKE